MHQRAPAQPNQIHYESDWSNTQPQEATKGNINFSIVIEISSYQIRYFITDDCKYFVPAFVNRMRCTKIKASNPSIIESRCII